MGISGKVNKYCLGDVLSQMALFSDQAQRGRMNEINIPDNQVAECRFGTIPCVFGQELLVVCHLYPMVKPRQTLKTDKNIVSHQQGLTLISFGFERQLQSTYTI